MNSSAHMQWIIQQCGIMQHTEPSVRRVPSRLQPWNCGACTLENPGANARCQLCDAPKSEALHGLPLSGALSSVPMPSLLRVAISCRLFLCGADLPAGLGQAEELGASGQLAAAAIKNDCDLAVPSANASTVRPHAAAIVEQCNKFRSS